MGLWVSTLVTFSHSPIVIFQMIKTFRAFIRKYIKYFFYVALILAIMEWADFFRGDELDLLRLVGNTALAFYFWGLSVGKFEFREDKIFNSSSNKKLNETDKDAFRILGLKFDADWSSIQKKFKTLVKKFHPDTNGGNKQFEDKLKKITMAYSHLKLKMVKK